MKTLSRGILISLEGIDGSGKTTLLSNLAELLTSDQFPYILTKEPGGTTLGKKFRTILQEQAVPLHPKTEFLLFAADRAEHFDKVVIPSLQKNMVVLSDRMADSSLAYQGFGRGLDKDLISIVNTWAMQGIQPDLTLYCKVPVEVAQKRLQSRKQLSSFDQEKRQFIEKLVTGFDTIFAARPHVLHLDATQPTEQLAEQAYTLIIQWLIAHGIFLPSPQPLSTKY